MMRHFKYGPFYVRGEEFGAATRLLSAFPLRRAHRLPCVSASDQLNADVVVIPSGAGQRYLEGDRGREPRP